jgi:SPASM domain peptide maturase of grasp-with-spasm system
VKGAARSIIYDLQRNKYDFVPNILFDILKNLCQMKIGEIRDYYHDKYNEILDEYFSFLLIHEYGFLTNDPNHFPELSRDFYSAEAISNCIIDIDEHSKHNYLEISSQLDSLNCKALQLRLYHKIKLIDIEEVLLCFISNRITYIEMMLPFQNELTEEFIDKLSKLNPRLLKVIVYESPFTKQQSTKAMGTQMLFVKKSINAEKDCGITNPSYFVIDIGMFTESHQFNSCLNKKISINRDGEIMNCPSMKVSYGNISNTGLKEVATSESFKVPWMIKKDNITICKDCEFRYMCVDCRAFVQNPQELLSKPLKCKYDPYTATFA